MMTATLTSAKAKRQPIEVALASSPSDTKPASSDTTTPQITMFHVGTKVRGLILANSAGTRPSTAMVYRMRVCPY